MRGEKYDACIIEKIQHLSNVASLKPPSTSVVIKELFCCFLWHLVIFLGNVPATNVDLQCSCQKLQRKVHYTQQDHLSSRPWLVCHSVIALFPVNQPKISPSIILWCGKDCCRRTWCAPPAQAGPRPLLYAVQRPWSLHMLRSLLVHILAEVWCPAQSCESRNWRLSQRRSTW